LTIITAGYETSTFPIQLVQSASVNSGGASVVTVGLPSLSTAGNTLIASVCLSGSASVLSVTKTTGGSHWIQDAYSYTTGGSSEIWSSRGVHGTSASITFTFSSAASVGVNVSEWSGIWYANPLDQWSQNFGTSASATTQAVTPRQAGDLFFAVVSTAASVSGPSNGYATLPSGTTTGGVAYLISNYDTSETTSWSVASSQTWATAHASFVAGPAGLNPQLQFPETLIEMCPQSDYLAPIKGLGIWTNVSQYARSMTLGPMGRQHELDRIQATQSTFTMDNRSGVFNPWNQNSFLGSTGCLDPMSPVKVTAAWDGITSPIAYSYVQEVLPVIGDVLNVDATITCMDILQMLSLKYLSSAVYADLVIADGGTDLVAYYRLGDQPGSYSVADSSGNGYTGSLISGVAGAPAFGAAGAFLFDSDTALDCTNGTNLPNGGFSMVDNTTQPPTKHDPFADVGGQVQTFECWFKYTDTTVQSLTGGFGNVLNIPNSDLMSASVGSGPRASIQIGTTLEINPFTGFPTVVATNAIIATPGWINQTWPGPSQTVSSGYQICPDATPEILWQCTGPGTSGSVEPAWHDYIGGGISDGSVTWTSATNFLAYYTPNGPVMDGQWHFAEIEVASGFSNSFQTDGCFVDGLPATANAIFASAGFSGMSSVQFGTGIEPFVGVLDEVALYGNNSNLSAPIAANHYNTGKWFQIQEYGASDGSLDLSYIVTISGTTASVSSGSFAGVTNGMTIYAGLDENASFNLLPLGTTVASVGTNTLVMSNAANGSALNTEVLFSAPSRFSKVMSVAGLPPVPMLNVPYEFKTLLYSETNVVTTTSALNYMQTQSESEPGIIFQSPSGMLNAYSRQYQYKNPTSINSQATISDSENSPYYYDGPSLQVTGDDLDTWNDIQVQSGIPATTTTTQTEVGVLQEWGPAQSAQAANSASVNGSRTLQGLTSLQMAKNSDALAIAQNYGTWYNNHLNRVTAITLNSQGNGGANLVQMLRRGLYDRLTIEYQGQTNSTQFSQESLIESVTHTVDMSQPTWITMYQMSPYEIIMTPFILDQSTLDGPDVLTL